MPQLPALAAHDTLVVQQIKEWTEVFTDFETANKYAILAPDGEQVMFAAERSNGMWTTVARQFMNTRRPFTIDVFDAQGVLVLHVERPFTWWLSRVEVRSADGTVIGTIQQRFSFVRRIYDVVDAGGRTVASITGGLFRWRTFVLSVAGTEVGRIAKQWGGLGKEMFTDADTFALTMGPALGEADRLLLVAATFLIDFNHFESSN